MADWRGGQRRRDPAPGPKPAARQVSASSKSGWRGSSTGGGGSSGNWGLWVKRILATAAVLAIMGLLIGILLWREDRTPLAVLLVQSHQYDVSFAIPPRPGASFEAEILNGKSKYLKSTSKGKDRKAGLLSQLDDIDRRSLNPGGPDKNVVLVAIAAQGVVNGKGEPCVLDTESNPFDESTWTSVTSIFSKLVERLPSKSIRVVVFFDSGSAESDWSLGWLHEDFTERLEGVVDRLPKPWHLIHVRGTTDLTTFTRTGRRVLFSNVLSVGLRGGADGIKSKQRDQKVSMKEMIAFVTRETGTAPDVWPKTENDRKNIDLCWAENADPNYRSNQLTMAQVPEKLEKLWEQHHTLDGNRPWRHRPWEWARFEWQLLRAERAWIASDANTERAIAEAEAQYAKLVPLPENNPAAKRLSFDEGPEWQPFFRQLEPKEIRLDLRAIPKIAPKISPAGALAYLLNRDVLDPKFVETVGAKSDSSSVRDLIGLRQVAESEVWPPDFRAEAIVRHEASEIDSERLALEDLAFLGGESNWKAIDTGVERLRQKYFSSKVMADDFAEKLTQRDKLFAKLPWVFRRAEVSNSKDDELKPLIRIWNDIADSLQHFESRVFDRSAPFDWAKWDAAWKAFDELVGEERYSKNAEQLIASKRSLGDWVRDARPFLATPLVSGTTRVRLLNALRDAFDKASKNDAAGKPEKVNEEVVDSGDTAIASWPGHPMSVFFVPEARNVDEGNRPRLDKIIPADRPSSNDIWWQAGESIRKRLKGVRESTYWNEILKRTPDNPKGFAEFYRSLVKYEGQGRATAVALSAGDPPERESPDRVISRLDPLQAATYYDWRARRAVLDFYGPTDPNPESSDPFYQRNAGFWQKLLGESGDDGRALSESLKTAAPVLDPKTQLLEVKVDPATLQFKDEQPKAKFAVVQVAAKLSGDLRPKGSVAVEIPRQTGLDQSSRPTGSERIGTMEPFTSVDGSGVWKKEISIQPGDTPVPLTAYFRGHVSSSAKLSRVLTKPELPIERDIPIPEPGSLDATVIVKGRSPQKLWLMVVLDCSLSMNENVSRKENVNRQRFDVAKTALKTMLRSLLSEVEVTQSELHIGLIAYGYRVGLVATKDERGAKLVYADPNKKTLTDEPPIQDEDTVGKDRVSDMGGLDPSLDVGVLVPIQNDRSWNIEAYLQMERLIDRRSPVGITPLYLSIVRAADHLRSLPNDAPKLILVITDGVDNQETLGNPEKRKSWGLRGKGADRTGVDATLNAIRGIQGLNVRIVGIGIPEEKDAKEADKDGLKSLARFCEGKNENGQSVRQFISTQDGEELAKQIAVSIPPVKVRVRSADGLRDPIEKMSAFGSPIKLENPAGRKFHIDVTRELDKVQQPLATTEIDKDSAVTIHGGEQLELLYIDKLKKLVFHRSWEGRTNDDDPPGANAKTGLIAADHVRNKTIDVKEIRNQFGKRWQAALLTPKVDGSTRRFRVAFRPGIENEPPARPIFVRAMIMPLASGDGGGPICPYFFESKDARFEPKEPVPVLEFVATNWKPEWENANLSIWVRPPGEAPASSAIDVPVIEDLFKEAGSDRLIHLTGANGPAGPPRDLKFAIGKRQNGSADDLTEISIEQEWDKSDQMPSIENLPFLQMDPGPKGAKRLVRVASQKVVYKFTVPTDDIGRMTYRLRILDTGALPDTRDQEKPVKHLRWEKIDVEK